MVPAGNPHASRGGLLVDERRLFPGFDILAAHDQVTAGIDLNGQIADTRILQLYQAWVRAGRDQELRFYSPAGAGVGHVNPRIKIAVQKFLI